MADLTFDIDAAVDFLVGLLNTPSPTGYHREAVAYMQDRFKAINGVTVTETRKGALLVKLPGASSDKPVGLTAHTDTLGLMVKGINGSGTLKTTRLGGMLMAGSESEGVTVRTQDDTRIRGTLRPMNTSVHVNREITKSERSEDTMEVVLDAKTSSKDETEALGVKVGDFIFVDPRVELTDTGFIKSRYLDDKASIACLYAALQTITQAGQTPPQDVYVLLSIYEEVGHGGSHGFPDDLAEVVSVDMAAIGDGQASDEFSVTICVKDSGGPYHFDMNEKLRKLAEAHGIQYKLDIYPYYASDGTAYWHAGGGAKVGLVGPGVANSHSYERMHRDALHHSAHLLARYMLAE